MEEVAGMFGPLLCFASDCTEGLTLGDFFLGLFLAAATVAGIVLLVNWLSPPE